MIYCHLKLSFINVSASCSEIRTREGVFSRVPATCSFVTNIVAMLAKRAIKINCRKPARTLFRQFRASSRDSSTAMRLDLGGGVVPTIEDAVVVSSDPDWESHCEIVDFPVQLQAMRILRGIMATRKKSPTRQMNPDSILRA